MPICLVGSHITASGNISSSGTITANEVDINGGTIDGTTIGGTSAAAGTFTTLNATSLNVTSITSSIVTSSILQTEGSNIFGDTIADTHTFNGHITASGNISASGNNHILGGSITSGDIFLTEDSSPTINMTDTTNNNSLVIQQANTLALIQFDDHADQDLRFDSNADGNHMYLEGSSGNTGFGDSSPSAKVDINGDLNVQSHITASGNISSSGQLIAASADFKDGNISNVGTIYADALADDATGGDTSIDINGTTLNIDVGGSTILETTTTTAKFSVPIETTSHITASGNISSSGTIESTGNISTDGTLTAESTITSNAGSLVLTAGKVVLGASPQIDVGASKAVTFSVNANAPTIFSNASAVSASNFSTHGHITASGNISSSGTLDVTGNVNFDGDLDVDGTTNLDAVDIDSTVQIDGATTFGVNGTGVNVKLFGGTSGRYMKWVENVDSLHFTDNAKINIGSHATETSGDTSIFHDGTNTKILNQSNVATSELQLVTNAGPIRISGSNRSLIVNQHITSSGNISSSGTLISNALTLSGLSNQGTEKTAVVINGSNVVGKRELGNDAFTSDSLQAASAPTDTFFVISDDGRAVVDSVMNQVSNKIGIGNATPPEKLTVGGNISASGFISTDSHITASGNISSSGDLSITGNVTNINHITASGNYSGSTDSTFRIGGKLIAGSKSFVIDRPEGGMLEYGVLEGQQNDVFYRGELKGDNVIYLPQEWEWLVDKNTITTQLTSIGKHQELFVKEIKE